MLVAGCMTTVSFRGPEGKTAPAEEDWALASQARILADAGVDFLMVEMLSHVERAKVELAAAASAGLPVWAGFSCVADEKGNLTLMNQQDEPLEESLQRIDLSGLDVAFIMHTRIPLVERSLAVLRSVWDGPVGAYPHGGGFMRPSLGVRLVVHAGRARGGRRAVAGRRLPDRGRLLRLGRRRTSRRCAGSWTLRRSAGRLANDDLLRRRQMRLQDKAIIVTGAAGGLGRQYAVRVREKRAPGSPSPTSRT